MLARAAINPTVGFGRRIRRKMADRNLYQIHEKTILRNDIEVRDQITRLEQIMRLSPLEKLAERTRDEERRLRAEQDRAREDRDTHDLVLLDSVGPVQVVMLDEKGCGVAGSDGA